MSSQPREHNRTMKLFFASDHAGFALKQALVAYAESRGYTVDDLGAHSFDETDDYPDVVTPCARKVAEENAHGSATHVFGVIVGASGQGEAMCANRVKGARAAVFYGEPRRRQIDTAGVSLDIVTSIRAHNDANILSIGARFVSEEEAIAALQAFLEVPFSGDARHARRLAKF